MLCFSSFPSLGRVGSLKTYFSFFTFSPVELYFQLPHSPHISKNNKKYKKYKKNRTVHTTELLKLWAWCKANPLWRPRIVAATFVGEVTQAAWSKLGKI